ncbi:hypothetical protein D3C71_1749700 [compost metagenome]
MPRSQLRLLAHELECKAGGPGTGRSGNRGFDFGRAMTGHHHRAARAQVGGLVQHMLQQRPPREALQNLGKTAFHTRALARGHDDEVQ